MKRITLTILCTLLTIIILCLLFEILYYNVSPNDISHITSANSSTIDHVSRRASELILTASEDHNLTLLFYRRSLFLHRYRLIDSIPYIENGNFGFADWLDNFSVLTINKQIIIPEESIKSRFKDFFKITTS